MLSAVYLPFWMNAFWFGDFLLAVANFRFAKLTAANLTVFGSIASPVRTAVRRGSAQAPSASDPLVLLSSTVSADCLTPLLKLLAQLYLRQRSGLERRETAEALGRMNPQCARCGKIVYPTEKVSCLDKVSLSPTEGDPGEEAHTWKVWRRWDEGEPLVWSWKRRRMRNGKKTNLKWF